MPVTQLYPQNVLFRVDGGATIGLGHVRRCQALAQALTDRNCNVGFVCYETPQWLITELQQQGYWVSTIDDAFDVKLNDGQLYPWETDAGATLHALQQWLSDDASLDWLVIDHYRLDARWHSAMRVRAKRIFVIDDLADRALDCDVLLDQNVEYEKSHPYRELLRRPSRLLSGPRYALVGARFPKARESVKPRNKLPYQVFVCMGGSDSAREETLKAIAGIADAAEKISVHLLVPQESRAFLQAIQRFTEAKLYTEMEDIAKFLSKMDVAVGAGGIMNWERSCLGIPSIVVSIAENQRKANEWLSELGAILYLGESRNVTSQHYADALRGLLACDRLRGILSRRSRDCVDGQGARRIARIMVPHPLQVRLAQVQDKEQIFHWHNAPETWRFAREQREISWTEHCEWFDAVTADSSRILLIGELEGDPIGVLRFDIRQDIAEVSVYLVPGKYGRGLGQSLLRAGESWLQEHRRDVKRLEAVIMSDNIASCRAFYEVGYRSFQRAYYKDLGDA